MTDVCKKCGEECQIDREFPKFFAWCYTCQDYAEGDDIEEYTKDWLASGIDKARERSKYE